MYKHTDIFFMNFLIWADGTHLKTQVPPNKDPNIRH